MIDWYLSLSAAPSTLILVAIIGLISAALAISIDLLTSKTMSEDSAKYNTPTGKTYQPFTSAEEVLANAEAYVDRLLHLPEVAHNPVMKAHISQLRRELTQYEYEGKPLADRVEQSTPERTRQPVTKPTTPTRAKAVTA